MFEEGDNNRIHADVVSESHYGGLSVNSFKFAN